MSTLIKLKPSKNRYEPNIKTLDELHEKAVKNFQKKKKSLPRKKTALKRIQNKLNVLENKDPIMLTTNDIQLRATYKTDIETLMTEIHDIENDISEIDYYTKIDEILMDYYDIVDNYEVTYDNIPNKKEKKEEGLDTLDKLNLLDKKKNKAVKTNKRRRKRRSTPNNVTNDIFSYICPEKKENEKKEVNKKDRSKLLEQYKSLVDNKYTPEKEYDLIRICSYCNIDKTLIPSEGIYVCKSCGEAEMVIIESERPNYKDSVPEKPGYPYKRSNHYSEWLAQLQAKESTVIPPKVYDKILEELNKMRIYDLRKLDTPLIREILKKLQLTQYYEHRTYIISKLSKLPPPTLSREMEDKLRKMFKQIQEPFEKHCPKDRINFLSYSYVLHKFCELLQLDEYIPYFPLLKSRDKLRDQDKIWKNICKDLKWQFIPSI